MLSERAKERKKTPEEELRRSRVYKDRLWSKPRART